MKKYKKILILLVLFCNIRIVNASVTANISVSTSNTIVGNSGTATLTINANGQHIGQIYGTFSCGALGDKELNFVVNVNEAPPTSRKYTINWTAKNAGTYDCIVKNFEVGTLDPAEFKTPRVEKKTITVAGKTSNDNSNEPNNSTTAEKKEYSSDNTLSSLSIDGYEITPKFNKDTLEYKLEVDEDIEKITIKGKTTDDKAEISGIGEKALTEGENKIEIKVTAENGNEKKYTIIVTVKDKNPITVMIDNKKYTVVKKNKDVIKKLDHYEEEKIKINNQEVISYINKVTKTRLVILKDKDNKLAYYIYNENTKKYQKYKSISVGNITLQILDYNKKIDNYKLYNIKINNEDIDIYKTKKNDEFGLIYGINIVTGNKSFYQYDEKEQTLARYNSKKNNNKLNIYKEETNKYKNYLMVSIGIICLILIIVLITSLIKSKKRKRRS